MPIFKLLPSHLQQQHEAYLKIHQAFSMANTEYSTRDKDVFFWGAIARLPNLFYQKWFEKLHKYKSIFFIGTILCSISSFTFKLCNVGDFLLCGVTQPRPIFVPYAEDSGRLFFQLVKAQPLDN